MANSRIISQSRQSLDAVFKDMGSIGRFKPPVRGWIKAIREALGMSSAQLAMRMGIKQPTLTEIEQSELRGTIQLTTLRRVAEAMDCTLVYALVPNKSLETTVRERARKVARRRLQSVEHSMALERQAVSPKGFEKRLDVLASEISPRALWDES
jgi:predicted DNA-binding mobile mystery protein A